MTHDKPRLVGAQEQNRRGEFVGFAHPADREQLARGFGSDFFFFHPLMENVAWRVDATGRYGVINAFINISTFLLPRQIGNDSHWA